MDSIEAAKKAGTGSCRFVTLGRGADRAVRRDNRRPDEGDAVPGIAGIEIEEARMKRGRPQSGRLSELNTEADSIRRRIASCQTEETGRSNEIRHLQQQVDGISGEIDSGRGSSLMPNRSWCRSKWIGKAEGRKGRRSRRNIGDAAEKEKLYSTKTVQQHKGKQQTGAAQDAKALREEVEGLKIRIATVMKENEMRSNRIAEIEKETGEKTKEMDALRKGMAALGKEIDEMGKSRAELEERIRSHDKKSAGLYAELHALEEKLTKISTEKGKLSSDMEKTERDLIELSTKKSQSETRMKDIRAELLSYSGVNSIEGRTIEQLEAGLAVSKSEIEKLGNVNLKAPEMYEWRRKDARGSGGENAGPGQREDRDSRHDKRDRVEEAQHIRRHARRS